MGAVRLGAPWSVPGQKALVIPWVYTVIPWVYTARVVRLPPTTAVIRSQQSFARSHCHHATMLLPCPSSELGQREALGLGLLLHQPAGLVLGLLRQLLCLPLRIGEPVSGRGKGSAHRLNPS